MILHYRPTQQIPQPMVLSKLRSAATGAHPRTLRLPPPYDAADRTTRCTAEEACLTPCFMKQMPEQAGSRSGACGERYTSLSPLPVDTSNRRTQPDRSAAPALCTRSPHFPSYLRTKFTTGRIASMTFHLAFFTVSGLGCERELGRSHRGLLLLWLPNKEKIHYKTYSLPIDAYITDSRQREHIFDAIHQEESGLGSGGSDSFTSIFRLKKRGLTPGLNVLQRTRFSHTDLACLLLSHMKRRPHPEVVKTTIT